MIGLAIDQDTNDLFLNANNELAVVTGAEAIGQHVRQRIKTYAGEWFLDTEAGMPWLEEVFGNQYDPALAEALVKAEIMATYGVVSIESLSVSFDRATRALKIGNVEIKTVYDEVAAV